MNKSKWKSLDGQERLKVLDLLWEGWAEAKGGEEEKKRQGVSWGF